MGGGVTLLLSFQQALADNSDPYFPRFHVRPAFGHVNDPNGPFYDPVHQYYHLFMQYRSYTAHTGGIGWAHFASKDLVKWTDLGMGIPTDGKGCPNTNGCFSGSAVVVDGNPTIVYPGVHHMNKSATHPDGVGMAQCLARPSDLNDPLLRNWTSITIVPTDPVPGNVNNHFHDDAEPWKSSSNGRWYTFASGGSFNRSYGVNLLYSTSEEEFKSTGGGWKQEHALWNITTGQCNFVSCPEMYSLPGSVGGVPRTSGPVVYESLCGCDQYWLGHYDDDKHTFTPNPAYIPPASGSRFCYDYGRGRASKSFWDVKTQRRLLWSWVTGPKHTSKSTWDGTQTVPRVIAMGPHSTGGRGRELAVTPAAEVAALRDGPAVLSVAEHAVPVGGGAVHDAGGVQLDVLLNISWPADATDLEAGVNVLVPRPVLAAGSAAGSAAKADANAEAGAELGCAVTLRMTRESADFLPDTNIPHGDLPHADFSLNKSIAWTARTGSQQCEKFCNTDPDCTCWTYVSKGADAPRCAIKGPTGKAGGPSFPVRGPDDVSGYKKGHVPSNLTISNATQLTVTACGSNSMPGHLASSTPNSAQLRVLVDRSVVEVFDGVAAMSFYQFPTKMEQATGVQLTSQNEGVRATLVVFKMNAAV